MIDSTRVDQVQTITSIFENKGLLKTIVFDRKKDKTSRRLGLRASLVQS